MFPNISSKRTENYTFQPLHIQVELCISGEWAVSRNDVYHF